MRRVVVITLAACFWWAAVALAQSQSSNSSPSAGQQPGSRPQNSQPSDNPDDILNSPMTPPRSDSADTASKPDASANAPKTNKPPEEFPFPEEEEKGNYSSSNDSRGDISPPSGDAKHPGAVIKDSSTGDVMETKPWNPHEADKDVEVGTFYFKRGNYKGAEARFRDALNWQDNDAEAMYRLGETLQKEGRTAEARPYYEGYLKILPRGPFANDCRKELDKLDAADGGVKKQKAASTSPSL